MIKIRKNLFQGYRFLYGIAHTQINKIMMSKFWTNCLILTRSNSKFIFFVENLLNNLKLMFPLSFSQ